MSSARAKTWRGDDIEVVVLLPALVLLLWLLPFLFAEMWRETKRSLREWRRAKT